MNPVDRDRGLRVVGVVTSAVTAVSLIGIGATTALAAGETRHRDALKAAGAVPAATVGEPVTEVPADAGPTTAAAKARAKTKPKATTRPRATSTRTKAAAPAATAAVPTTTKARATTSPKPKTPATTTAAAADPTTEPTTVPPTVPSTGS